MVHVAHNSCVYNKRGLYKKKKKRTRRKNNYHVLVAVTAAHVFLQCFRMFPVSLPFAVVPSWITSICPLLVQSSLPPQRCCVLPANLAWLVTISLLHFFRLLLFIDNGCEVGVMLGTLGRVHSLINASLSSPFCQGVSDSFTKG